MNDVKSGWKTSEFWLLLIGKALVFAVGIGLISQDKANEVSSHLTALVGGVFAVVALWHMAGSYLASRTSLKQTAANLEAKTNADGPAVLPFALAALIFALAVPPAPAQLFGGWRTAILLDHERRIATLEGKTIAPPAPSSPAPIVFPPAATPTPSAPAPQPIVIVPPAPAVPSIAPQPAQGPLVFVVPSNGANGPNPQPIQAIGVNPHPIPATGPNPQVISPLGPNPQVIPGTGPNPQPLPATGNNPQPIQPRPPSNPQPASPAAINPQPIAPGTASSQPLPIGLNPPPTLPPAPKVPSSTPSASMPPASNPHVIPATSNSPGWRAVRYANGQMVYYYQR